MRTQNVDFLITTMDRYDLLAELLDSIFEFYPHAKVTVADQSKELEPFRYEPYNVRVIPLRYDCGLSHARNVLVTHTNLPYKLILEDDFKFDGRTDIERMVALLEAFPN